MTPFPNGFTDMVQVDKDLFERAWKVVQECGEEERHFNQVQGIYRGLASTWILATLGAIGYLLFNKEMTTIPRFHLDLVASIVCFVGAAGVTLISILDLGVYHKLLVAVFDEGRKLEQEFRWLPQFRTHMKSTVHPVRNKLAWYYVGTVGLPLVMACYFLALFLVDKGVVKNGWFVILMWMVVAALLDVLYSGITRRDERSHLIKAIKFVASRIRGFVVTARRFRKSFHTGLAIKTLQGDLKEMCPEKNIVVHKGLHITNGETNLVIFSDVQADRIHLTAIKTHEDCDFTWCADQAEFLAVEGTTLRSEVERLVG